MLFLDCWDSTQPDFLQDFTFTITIVLGCSLAGLASGLTIKAVEVKKREMTPEFV